MAVRNLGQVFSGERVIAVSSVSALVVNAALVALVFLGLAIRTQAAIQQPLFIDEAFSLLAIQETAAHGLPMLPTGVLYLHGSTLSYLLAPLALFKLVDHDDLALLRLVSVVAGTASIFLTYRLALRVGCARVVALFAAALVALDPASVEWGGYLRMYAPAQFFSLAAALLFIMMMQPLSDDHGRRHRLLVRGGLVLVCWLAVFTHLATAMLIPAMVLVSLVVFGRTLLASRRDVTATLAACLAAPLTLVALSGMVGTGAGTKIPARSEGIPGVAFLGDDKVSFQQLTNPDPAVWASLFGPGPLENLLPLFVTVASTLILIVGVLQTAARPRTFGAPRDLFAILALYWTPILALAFLAGDTSTRYGLFLIPLGCVILGAALETAAALVGARFALRGLAHGRGTLLAVLLAILILAHDVVGLAKVNRYATSDRRDLAALLHYVSEQRQPEDWVVTTLPPPMSAYVLQTAAKMVFLPGGELSNRTLRYTRIRADGRPVDYWLGVPALPTTGALCGFLTERPGTWLIVSDVHWNSWGFSGGAKSRNKRRAAEMRALIMGIGSQVFEHRQGLVFRVKPPEEWDSSARDSCDKAINRHERKVQASD
jgi:hypothetical protein